MQWSYYIYSGTKIITIQFDRISIPHPSAPPTPHTVSFGNHQFLKVCEKHLFSGFIFLWLFKHTKPYHVLHLHCTSIVVVGKWYIFFFFWIRNVTLPLIWWVFFGGVVLFLLLFSIESCMCCLSILEINPLVTSFVNIFSQSGSCFLFCLWFSLLWKTFKFN